jgi:hypothetical protein
LTGSNEFKYNFPEDQKSRSLGDTKMTKLAAVSHGDNPTII